MWSWLCVLTQAQQSWERGLALGSVTRTSEHSGHPHRGEAESGCTPWLMQADSPAWKGKWLGKQ